MNTSSCSPSSTKLHFLLRSSWQTVNIGDIGHTFGFLEIFRKYAPDITITLWPLNIDGGVREKLTSSYPEVRLAEGTLNEQGEPDSEALRCAFAECDIYVHGSAPSLIVAHDLAMWNEKTGKPSVLFGITMDPTGPMQTGNWEGGTLEQLSQQIESMPHHNLNDLQTSVFQSANLIYCRDTLTKRFLEKFGLHSGHVAFGADATFGFAPAAPDAANDFLREHGLIENEYLCVVPRLRYTPYHRMHDWVPEDAATKAKDAVNDRTEAHDMGLLVELVVRWVRETGKKVLLCPEMTYEVPLAKTAIYDLLPEDVRAKTVWLDRYWLPDEALAVYAAAHSIVSIENHSPILALISGTPIIYLRQPTDTIKGQMWRDLGMADWFFEIGETSVNDLWQPIEGWLKDYPGARRTAASRQAAIESQWSVSIDQIRSIKLLRTT